ncbi:MAG TPA: hypothetical protein PLV70_10335, partial [Flavobacteriales bacterium]|nr:hypothetical protein [Flavobacteriales bacterium]
MYMSVVDPLMFNRLMMCASFVAVKLNHTSSSAVPLQVEVMPEFVAPAWDYFDNRVHDESVATGREMA